MNPPPVHSGATDSLPAWLDMLQAVIPPAGCLIVGAGTGTGPIVRWLAQTGFSNAVLIEGEPNTFRHLARNAPDALGWVLKLDVVAPPGPRRFHVAANVSESGLLPAESLNAIWPNLRTQSSIAIEHAIELNSLLMESPANWLVVDCLPVADLLIGTDLAMVDLLLARVIVEGQPGVLEAAGLNALRHLVEPFGLRLATCLEERHPAVGIALFVRDVQAQHARLTGLESDLQRTISMTEAEAAAKAEALERCASLASQVTELQAAMDVQSKTEAHALARCEVLVEKAAALQAAIDAQAQTSAAEAEARRQALAQCESLTKQVAELQSARDAEARARTGEAQAKLQALARCESMAQEKAQLAQVDERSRANFDKLLRSVESSVRSEIANAVKQIEAFSNVREYIASGQLMPPLHDWAVSPDFALLLVQILECNTFDAIIEFGSGSSTLLIAHALMHQAQNRPRTCSTFQVAFEHLEKYHAGTSDLLAGAGLRDKVRLVLAPLTETVVASGDTYNYYDPGNALNDLAQRLAGVDAPRILAVVDGPPETTGPLARYPALEMLLNAFPRQKGFLVLDDYRRPGEQEIAHRWREFLKARGVEPEVTEYALEKRACVIRFDSSALTV